MIYRDHFQNYKRHNLPKAQLIIADIPYNLGNNAYASNPAWYADGDNKNGESALAGKSFFDTDEDFRPAEFMHFCSTMLKAEKKPVKVEGEARQKGDAPCMIIFCAFNQQMYLIELAKRYGLNNYINLVFRKNFSAQVLKANMKIVGNCEYGLVLYRDRLPKFRNNGKMIFNCMDWPRDNESEKIHPTQKPVELLKTLISIFTDEGDVVIDPVAGSGSTLIAAERLNRKGFGFEIKKEFFTKANTWLAEEKLAKKEIKEIGFAKTKLNKIAPTLWTCLLFLSILFASCSLKPLHKTGNYYVKNVADSTYQFYFVKGKYLIKDSILPGKNAKIKIIGTRDLSKVNVFIIQKK